MHTSAHTTAFVESAAPYKYYVDHRLTELIAAVSSRDLRSQLHTALFPGRRMRAVLGLRLCHGTDPVTEIVDQAGRFAVAVELVHRASIVVDDMVDRDNVRRRRPAVHRVLGLEDAALISHVLTSWALTEFAAIDSDTLRAATDAYALTARAEFADSHWDLHVSDVSTYRVEILPKTNQLFRLVVDYSSRFTGHTSSAVSGLGVRLGNVVQMSNDIADMSVVSVRSRGVKNAYRLNLNLLVAIARQGGYLPPELTDKTSADLTPKEFLRIRTILSRPEIQASARSLIDEELSGLSSVLLSASSAWQSIIGDFLHWVTDVQCWDQNLFAEAGF